MTEDTQKKINAIRQATETFHGEQLTVIMTACHAIEDAIYSLEAVTPGFTTETANDGHESINPLKVLNAEVATYMTGR